MYRWERVSPWHIIPETVCIEYRNTSKWWSRARFWEDKSSLEHCVCFALKTYKQVPTFTSVTFSKQLKSKAITRRSSAPPKQWRTSTSDYTPTRVAQVPDVSRLLSAERGNLDVLYVEQMVFYHHKRAQNQWKRLRTPRTSPFGTHDQPFHKPSSDQRQRPAARPAFDDTNQAARKWCMCSYQPQGQQPAHAGTLSKTLP